jgi:hypothetical protein
MLRMLALSLVLSAAAADPPKGPAVVLFGAPAPATAVTSNAPTQLDPGKFVWVTFKDYTGPVEWDISGDVAAVRHRPLKPKTLVLATRQGTPAEDEYESPDGPGATEFVRGVSAGRVRMVAWGVRDNRPVRVFEMEVVVGGKKPDDTDGGKKDPILEAVQATYGADQSPTKLADAKRLASAYRKAAGLVTGKTTAAEVAAMVVAERSGAVADRLSPTRELFGVELEKVMPADGATVLSAEQKSAAAAQLARFATLLESLK